ncbi:MAG: hypothetical protein ACT4PM_01500 [Gemmatimonadales bacterium]
MRALTRFAILAASLPASLAAQSASHEEVRSTVELDRSRHHVIVTAGPFSIPTLPPGMKHEDMTMMNDHNTPVYRFEWPVDGWARGLEVELLDSVDNPIDRRLVHHMIVVNFGRRQLLYPSFERLGGIGQETPDTKVPKSVGVPLSAGNQLGFYLAWANDTGKDLEGVQFRMRMLYSPKNLTPPPVEALPIYMDVNLTVGKGNDFDVPPGKSEKSWTFTPPVSGRILGVGGHLHDYGVAVRLEDAETGKVLAQVTGVRSSDGKVHGVKRKLFAVAGEGLRLKEGHRYRVVGVYDNPTGALIPKGAMAHMSGLFVPDDPSRWPVLDLNDPTLQNDLTFLNGMGGGGHKHH